MRPASDTAEATSPLESRSRQTHEPLLEMRGIVKRFGATTALNGIDLDVRSGEVHALLGENGAGKSTLMHVLTGLTRPDHGQIRLEGRVIRPDSPRSARRHGVAMVHQHFTLVPAFTVAENLALDASSHRTGLTAVTTSLRYSVARDAASALDTARSLGWDLPPDARVADLPVGTQQRMEIVKALATGARLLIFDEPTAVLAGSEVEELFAVMRQVTKEGRAVILIAHKLAEILAVADRVTVLRKGNRVASVSVRDTDAPELAAWMIGIRSGGREGTEKPPGSRSAGDSENTAAPHAAQPPPGEAPLRSQAIPAQQHSALQASNLVILGDRGERAISGVSLEVRAGEIFGIGGVDGNGQTELAEALVGLRPLQSGVLQWKQGDFRPGHTLTTGFIPQDRRRHGLSVSMSVEDNLLFDAVKERAFRKGPFLRRRALRALASELVTRFDIRIPGLGMPVSSLSGGNQQKIVVARALRSHPEWLVAVNPTRGLDIGAARFVQEELRQARDRGAAVLLISTDLDEIAALSDRAAILAGGTLTETKLEAASAADIGLLLGGIQTVPSVGTGPGEAAPR